MMKIVDGCIVCDVKTDVEGGVGQVEWYVA
jgi:hypothetical protein